MSTRKAFLKSGAIAAFGISIGGVPGFVARAAQQFQHKELFQKNKILICIFQRGAMDGLMAVTPFNDPYLKKARPSLFMSAAKSEKVSLIDLDGQFGLHPSMSIFEPLFKNNQLAIVHGIGSPNNTRSHFDAQDYMESGTPFKKSTDSGWLNRAAGLMEHQATPFRAVSLTPALPRSFYGNASSIAINNLADFKISSNQATKIFTKILGGDELKPSRAAARALVLFEGAGIGADLESAKGTGWGALNAVTQLVDWENARTSDARIRSAWFGYGANLKQQTLDALATM
jgi:uncharacterized protein (DUF1501 family)